MRSSMSIWQTDAVPLKWPLSKDTLTEIPYSLWALGGAAGLFLLFGALDRGLPAAENPQAEALRSQVIALGAANRDMRSELELKGLEIERLQAIQGYSAQFGIPANLATQIYDIALAEDLDPELGFRLIRVESSFRRNVVSPKGAIGYAQILPSTARWLDPTVETKDLFETATNLHLGFRYLRYLLDEYGSDTRLALLAYNRGPTRVEGLLSLGIDPANGYAKAVLGE